MRASSARLLHSTVRLAELTFPSTGVLLPRTRLAFVHLDNLLSFAKADRDGRVDAWLAGYLPDEIVLLFFRAGEPVNAGAIRPEARCVLPVEAALERLRAELERGEAVYARAPAEQLDWMWASCAAPAELRFVNERDPEKLFPVLTGENFSGIVELISGGQVNYLQFVSGRYTSGHFSGRAEDQPVVEYIESLFRAGGAGPAPDIAASTFNLSGPMPTQATSAQRHGYQALYRRFTLAVEREWPEDGSRHVARVADQVRRDYPAFATLTGAEGAPTATADQLHEGFAAWAGKVLQDLEVVVPGAAVRLLRDETREQRYMLQAAGFYARLPWSVEW